jgi:hypothetical protein
MSIILDGTTGLAGPATGALNGTLGATTPTTIAATNVTATTVTASGVVGTSATGALTMPAGTTAQRPTPVIGMIR